MRRRDILRGLPLFLVGAPAWSRVAGARSLADDEPKAQNGQTESEGPIIPLFNGRNLAGWTTYIDHKDKSNPRSDPRGVFRVEGGVIQVSGEEFGLITTEKEYANYHLTVEFKWGEKRWPPRQTAPRDSGILIHCVGPEKIWTKSIECQIQEHDCGDFWLVDGTSITIDGEVERRYHKKRVDAEKKADWNTVEVVCLNGHITNIVNGIVVNRGDRASVVRGKIGLQSEGAEIFYRKVEIRMLPV